MTDYFKILAGKSDSSLTHSLTRSLTYLIIYLYIYLFIYLAVLDIVFVLLKCTKTASTVFSEVQFDHTKHPVNLILALFNIL